MTDVCPDCGRHISRADGDSGCTKVERRRTGDMRGSRCDLLTIANLRAENARLSDEVERLRAELPDLEACAELIVKLDEHGPAHGNRERVKLLADWQRVRVAERGRVASPVEPK